MHVWAEGSGLAAAWRATAHSPSAFALGRRGHSPPPHTGAGRGVVGVFAAGGGRGCLDPPPGRREACPGGGRRPWAHCVNRRPGESGGARWLVLQRDGGAASALSWGRGLDLEGKSDGAGRNRCTEYGASLLRKKCLFWCGPDRSEIQRLAGKCGASLRESSLSINSNECL